MRQRDDTIGLSQVLEVVAGSGPVTWRASADFDVTGPPAVGPLAKSIYDAADRGTAIGNELFQALAAAGAQVIDGTLTAVSCDTHRVVLRLQSIRGDEWDLESEEPGVTEAIRNLPGTVRRPE